MNKLVQDAISNNRSGIFDGLFSVLTNGRSVGVDGQRLKNAQMIADKKYKDALNKSNRKQINGLNGADKSFGNSRSNLNNYLDIVSRFGGNPANQMASQDARSLNSLRQINSDMAGYGKEAMQLRSDILDRAARRDQGFNQDNVRLASDLANKQIQTKSNVRQAENLQTGAINLDSQNQDFFNTLALGKQQVKDNENQRKYDLEMTRLNSLKDIYTNVAPQNMLF